MADLAQPPGSSRFNLSDQIADHSRGFGVINLKHILPKSKRDQLLFPLGSDDLDPLLGGGLGIFFILSTSGKPIFMPAKYPLPIFS